MKREEILRRVDHTLLKQEAVWEEIRALCDDAVAYGVASVCIPPCYVRQEAGYLGGRVPVCTVVGFPNGNTTTAAKVFETREAIGNGAAEIDMVINLGWLRDKKYPEVLEKVDMCRIVTQAGADFIKTSTGFSTGGATPGDVGLLAREVGPGVRVKAAGGISSWEDAEEFIRLGASRLGTSRLVKLAKAERT